MLIVRIAYILSANPIGELTQELVYLRAGDLRAPVFIAFCVLLLEAAEFFYPFATTYAGLAERDAFVTFLNAFQALLLLATIILLFILIQRYTHRGLDRRIRDSMETLAYLAGQRRRRSRRAEDADEPPSRRYE